MIIRRVWTVKLAVAIGAVAGLTSCGDGATRTVDPGRGAHIVLREVHRQDANGPSYIEGAIQFVELTRQGERDAALKVELTRRPNVRPIAPGDYRVVSYTRPCSASCGAGLDPPTDRCRGSVSIKRGERRALRVMTVVGRPCAIRPG